MVQNACVICDEADEIIEKHAASIKTIDGKVQITGLAAAHKAKRLILLGATFSVFDKAYLAKILKISDERVMSFDSLQKITNPGQISTDEDIEKFVVLCYEAMLDKFSEICSTRG